MRNQVLLYKLIKFEITISDRGIKENFDATIIEDV